MATALAEERVVSSPIYKALEEQRDRIKNDRNRWKEAASKFNRPSASMPTYDDLLEQNKTLENQVNVALLSAQEAKSANLAFSDGLRYAIAQELDLTGNDWQSMIFAHREITRFDQGWPIPEDPTKLGTHMRVYWRQEYERVISCLQGRYSGKPPSDVELLALVRAKKC